MSKFIFLFLSLFVLLTGCPNPNIYGTPRTVPEGEVTHTVALEAYVGRIEHDDDDRVRDETIVIPSIPTYVLRYGLGDAWDGGFKVSNANVLGTDLKYNFVRSEVLDLAVDPGGQVNVWPGDLSIAYWHAPLLIGINASDSTTLLATVGYSGAAGSDESAVFPRAGLGLEVRPSQRFALQPEVTCLWGQHALCLAGLGLTFGSLPSRNDP